MDQSKKSWLYTRGIKYTDFSILIFIICFAAISIAIISQHVFDMQPCAWCVLQRLIFIIIGVVSLFCIFLNNFDAIRNLGFKTIAVFSWVGFAVAFYQFEFASGAFDCNISLAEKIITALNLNEILPQVFGIFALCADANQNLLGIPYVLYSGMLFILIFNVVLVVITKKIENQN